MEDKLRTYIDQLFLQAPPSPKREETKEEMYQNLLEKYRDLIAQGSSEQAAYHSALSSIGDVSGIMESLRKEVPPIPPVYYPQPSPELEKKKQLRAILIAVGVGLCIFSIVPAIIFSNDLGAILMFSIIAVAVGILVYAGSLNVKGNTAAVFTPPISPQEERYQETNRLVNSIAWTLILLAYIALSFATHAWYITWMIFPIGAAVKGVVRGIMDLKRGGQ